MFRLVQSDNGFFVMAELSPKQLAKKRQYDRTYYQSLSPEKLAERRRQQAEYMRRKRAKLKSAAGAPRIAPDASKPVSASMTPARRKTAPQTKPAKSTKPKSERAKHREWRGNVVDYLIDCLTDPACELLTGEWFERHRIGSMWLGFYDKLDQIERTVDDKPDVLTELRLSIAIEALRRLSGETPAGSAPTTPGTALKAG
jgi:hypothetical protein